MSCGMCNCCCHNRGFHRRYYTKEEKIAQLEDYLKDLENEMKAVKEVIKRLKEEECSCH